jgi:hypothetical protein
MILVVALVLFAAGLALIGIAWRELLPSRIFLTRPTSPTRDLKPGAVEAAGVLRADGVAPLTSAFGASCVVVVTIVEQRVGRNVYREESRQTVSVPATLTDATGACAVRLSHVDVMGDSWEFLEVSGRRTTQIVVRDGANVYVAGTAAPADAPLEGYRGAAPRLAIGPGEDTPLLISVGSQTNAVWSYGWRALVGMVCGITLLALGGAAAWIHAALP